MRANQAAAAGPGRGRAHARGRTQCGCNAEERLSQARATADKRDYEQAQQLVEESRVDSELATVKSRLGKAREKVEARTRENAQLRQDLSSNVNAAAEDAQP